MAVQQVHLYPGELLPVAHDHAAAAGGKACCVQASLSKEAQAVAAEVIIHGGIEHIPGQPVACRLPDLTDKQCVGIGGLDRLAEGAPEAVVHLTGHVQPPAVDLEFLHPVNPHPEKIVPHVRVGRVELWHHAFVGIGGVGGVGVWILWPLHGKLEAIKPRAVGGLLLLFHHVLKGPEVPAAVVEHAVDDDPDSLAMEGVHHPAEGFIAAEAGIHMEIVQRVVLVVFPGGKDGIEVDAVNPQILEIGGIGSHAVQGAAQAGGDRLPLVGGGQTSSGDLALS